MDNDQTNLETPGLPQFKGDDFPNAYAVTGNDGFCYTLAMHKSACLLEFGKFE
jgi:hypothetical protein